jgi:hypothetical protein
MPSWYMPFVLEILVMILRAVIKGVESPTANEVREILERAKTFPKD